MALNTRSYCDLFAYYDYTKGFYFRTEVVNGFDLVVCREPSHGGCYPTHHSDWVQPASLHHPASSQTAAAGPPRISPALHARSKVGRSSRLNKLSNPIVMETVKEATSLDNEVVSMSLHQLRDSHARIVSAEAADLVRCLVQSAVSNAVQAAEQAQLVRCLVQSAVSNAVQAAEEAQLVRCLVQTAVANVVHAAEEAESAELVHCLVQTAVAKAVEVDEEVQSADLVHCLVQTAVSKAIQADEEAQSADLVHCLVQTAVAKAIQADEEAQSADLVQTAVTKAIQADEDVQQTHSLHLQSAHTAHSSQCEVPSGNEIMGDCPSSTSTDPVSNDAETDYPPHVATLRIMTYANIEFFRRQKSLQSDGEASELSSCTGSGLWDDMLSTPAVHVPSATSPSAGTFHAMCKSWGVQSRKVVRVSLALMGGAVGVAAGLGWVAGHGRKGSRLT